VRLGRRLFGQVALVVACVINLELDNDLVARGIRSIVLVVTREFVAGTNIVVVGNIVVADVFVFLLVLFEAHDPSIELSSYHALALLRLFVVLTLHF